MASSTPILPAGTREHRVFSEDTADIGYRLDFIRWNHPVLPEEDIETRFYEAGRWLRYVDSTYLRRGAPRPLLVEFHPPPQSTARTHQLTFPAGRLLRLSMLFKLVKRALSSDQTMQLEGSYLQLKVLGRAMSPSSGEARPPGFQAIPPHLRQRGLQTHPLEAKRPDTMGALVGGCGPRALVFSAHPGIDFHHWLQQSADLAQQLDLDPLTGSMRHQDILQLVRLPDWRTYRVVLFNALKVLQLIAVGADWDRPADLPRDQPDPNTLFLCFDPAERHYWSIQKLKTFMLQKNVATRDLCHICFKTFPKNATTVSLTTHQCETIIDTLYCCPHCHFTTYDEAVAADHRQPGPIEYPTCEGGCGRTQFYGPICHGIHVLNSCSPRAQPCEHCFRAILPGSPHVCSFTLPCRTCKTTFESVDEKRNHRCYLQPYTTFFDQVQLRKGVNGSEKSLFEVHWAADFETCLVDPLPPDARTNSQRYPHRVTNWKVQYLRLQADLLDDYELRPHYDAALQRLRSTFPDIRKDESAPGFYRVQGESMASFMAFLNQVGGLSEPGVFEQNQVLWFHNGSRFDAKYVLNHLMNEERRQITGAQYRKTFHEDTPLPEKTADGQFGWKRAPSRRSRGNEVVINDVDGRILTLKFDNITIRDSAAHLSFPLRNVPAAFNLPTDVAKGEFPYPLIAYPSDYVHEMGLPDLVHYDVDAMDRKRRTQVVRWWIEEQHRRRVPLAHLQPQLEVLNDYAAVWMPLLDTYPRSFDHPPIPWRRTAELDRYLTADVHVLALALESYHQLAITIQRETIHPTCRLEDNERFTKFVSPLQVATAPSFAYAIYRAWFMPKDELAVLTNTETKFVRPSLRGGRTDKRATLIEIPPDRIDRDEIGYFDFTSLYPSVMKREAHRGKTPDLVEGTYYPVGAPQWIPAAAKGACTNERFQQIIGNRCGFVRVDAHSTAYHPHPILHRLTCNLPPFDSPEEDSPEKTAKLLYDLYPKRGLVYPTPELMQAINAGGVEITRIYEGLLFDKGHPFRGYVETFFAIKDQATQDGNSGMITIAKLLLNSLWGKMGQRSYPVTEWVTCLDRLNYLSEGFANGTYELHSLLIKDSKTIRVRYSNFDDYDNRDRTAPQLACFVSAWGRTLLHTVLHELGDRALYCDTDSVIVYLPDYRRGSSVPQGPRVLDIGLPGGLGRMANELPKILKGSGGVKGVDYIDPRITSVVMLAPKTYALKVTCPVTGWHTTKVVAKGFEPSYDNSKEITYQAFRELAADTLGIALPEERDRLDERPKRHRITTLPRLHFVSSTTDAALIAPHQTYRTKTLSGEYNKGLVHPADPRFNIPFTPPEIEIVRPFLSELE